MSHHYEDELDEMLIKNNPNGGRPMAGGTLVWKDQDGRKTYEIDRIKEEVAYRFMLGYCPCGRKIVIGTKRAEILMKALEKQGIKPRVPSVPFRERLARKIAGEYRNGETYA